MAGGQGSQWLARWRAGDAEALDRLVPLVYDELRQVARRQIHREPPGQTLSATALDSESHSSISLATATTWGARFAQARQRKAKSKASRGQCDHDDR